MTVGKNIKRIRKEKGLTQKKLGELCGIAEPTIRKYESDKLNPKIETVDKIASALRVNIVDIMEQFTMEQWKNTSECKQTENSVQVQEGIMHHMNEPLDEVTEVLFKSLKDSCKECPVKDCKAFGEEIDLQCKNNLKNWFIKMIVKQAVMSFMQY